MRELPDGALARLDSVVGRATVGDQLRRHARNQPDHLALATFDGSGAERVRLTYRALNERVNRVANSLATRGIGRGDVVAVISRNTEHYVTTYLAAAKLGAVTTGVNHNFQTAEMAYQLDHCEPRVLVVDDQLGHRLAGLDEQLARIELRVWADSAVTPTAPAQGAWDVLSDYYAPDVSAAEPAAEVHERDVLFLIYTSGTEAFPKAVMIPHRNYAISTVPAWAIGSPSDVDTLSGGIVRSYDRWLFLTPLHTIAGLGNFTIVLSIGASVIMPEVVDAALSIALIDRERVTAMVQTPTFFLATSQHPSFAGADGSTVERLLTYGGTMPESMIAAWNAKSPALRWATYWGQSELTQLGTMGWFRELGDIPGGDTSWIGRPVGSLELRLVDPAGDDSDVGEAWCRSPSVMLGYYRDPERTAAAFDGGWLHTGDVMRRDEHGHLYFLDRRKDMIKTGGYNVSSQEVERTLYTRPEVRHAAVVGLPDPYWSEAVTAFVVAVEGRSIDPAALIAHCKQHLVNYKVPKAVHVLDALPVDGQGKVLKRELRRLYTVSDER